MIRHSYRTWVVVMAMALLPFRYSAKAEVAILHHFGENETTSANPRDAVASIDGWLVGSTFEAGANGSGSVYRIRTDGTDFGVVHNFDDIVAFPNTGSLPTGKPIVVAGQIVSVTNGGGDNDEGTIYRMRPDGTGYVVLHHFDSFIDSVGVPSGGLVTDGSSIFGATLLGDETEVGGVFRAATNGTDVIQIHQFPNSGVEGLSPQAPSMYDGFLYGVTVTGGANSKGTLYQLDTNGSHFRILHSFSGKTFNSTDGGTPVDQVIGIGSRLFGVTAEGGQNDLGTIYSVGVDGSGFQILHDFRGDDGWSPESGLTLVGDSLFGVTSRGGAFGDGTIFSIGPDGSHFRLRHNFDGEDGATPIGQLVLQDSQLFGTTLAGGQYNAGVLFSVSPSPKAGDYNLDGNVDRSDYFLWKREFGSTSLFSADGNGNGVVDAADYTIWRDHVSRIELSGDYDRDGNVDGDDFLTWKESFGSMTKLAADGNGNGVVDAADYTVWRDNFGAVSNLVLVGDYDGDKDVDGDDFSVWKQNFGSDTSLAADGNRNGIVDAADYTIWRDHLGGTAGSGNLSIVPEPATWLMMLAGIPPSCCRRFLKASQAAASVTCAVIRQFLQLDLKRHSDRRDLGRM